MILSTIRIIREKASLTVNGNPIIALLKRLDQHPMSSRTSKMDVPVESMQKC